VATIAEAFALALQNHQAGNFLQAEQLYRQILQSNPRHAETHHSLGILAYQLGRASQAAASIRQAVALQPLVAGYHANLGLAHEALGQLSDAVASYQLALSLQPDLAEAHNNLANVLRKQGKFEEAVAHCRQALRVRPAFAEAENNLASALLERGQADEAIAHFRQALQSRPDYAEAHCNLGLALASTGHLDDATAHYRQALQFNPHSAEAHNNLATALVTKGEPAEAETHCRHALRLRPDYPEAFNNLGNALQDQRKLAAAEDCYRRALRLQPSSPEACYNLGNVLRELGKLEEAGAWFQHALRLRPHFAFAHNNLGNVLLKQGRPDLALANFGQALRDQPDLVMAQSNYLFCLNYNPEGDPDEVFAEHRRWGERLESKCHSERYALGDQHTNDPDPQRRLRIGYVSPDLRYHALVRYLEPVLAHHDPEQVEVHCYAEVAYADDATKRLQKLAHGWCWTSRLTDTEAAERIRKDRIDILVDLAGHTAGNRLGVFALKPAPVQATWMGYLNTTGLKAIDYRLTDDILDPPGKRVRGTEELVRLPAGMCCFATLADAPAVAPLPAFRRGHVTFGSLQSLFKLNAQVFDLWSGVLKALPTSRLLMFRDTLTDTGKEYICGQFKQRGILPERLDLRRGTDAPGYLDVYGEIDVCLDTFPFSGGVSTCESMWMGVPVLSLMGETLASRNSASLLTRVGLSKWAVHSPEQFVALARSFAENLDHLAELRGELRVRVATKLCDANRFTRGLEDAYRNMWRRWCAEQSLPSRLA
jgi:protein O-GlcNAc transferase